MRVKYRGPLDRVRIPLPGGRELVVANGETAEVPDPLGESLLAQSDWARSAARAKGAPEPAPAGETPEKEE